MPELILSQSWKMVKERDGITTYSRPEPGFSVKAYKCETEFRGDMEKVIDLLTDVRSFDAWDDKISELVVVEEEQGEYYKYCLVYDLSWPLKDRDLCIDARTVTDAETGIVTIHATGAPELIPPHPDRVRIVDYWQNWIVRPLEDGLIRLTLEGFADPAGSVPAWITNMALTDSPVKSISEVRKRAEE